MRLPVPCTGRDGIEKVDIRVEFRLGAEDLAIALSLHYKFHEDPAVVFTRAEVHHMIRTVLWDGGDNVRYRWTELVDTLLYTPEQAKARMERARRLVDDVYQFGQGHHNTNNNNHRNERHHGDRDQHAP